MKIRRLLLVFSISTVILASCKDDISVMDEKGSNKTFIPTAPISLIDGRMVFVNEDILSEKINRLVEGNSFNPLDGVEIDLESDLEMSLRAAPDIDDPETGGPGIGRFYSYCDKLYDQATASLTSAEKQEIKMKN